MLNELPAGWIKLLPHEILRARLYFFSTFSLLRMKSSLSRFEASTRVEEQNVYVYVSFCFSNYLFSTRVIAVDVFLICDAFLEPFNI